MIFFYIFYRITKHSLMLCLVPRKKKRKLVFWWGHLGNIWFSEPNFMKSKNQLLMWKVTYFSCTLSRLHILCRDCPRVQWFSKIILFIHFFPSRTHHPPLPPFPVKSADVLLVSSLVATHTSLWSAISPSLPFPSLYLSLGDVEMEGKREKKGKERERGGDCRPKRAVSDGRWWRRQNATRFYHRWEAARAVGRW